MKGNPQHPDGINGDHKSFSIRTVLNVYGIFASLGLLLSIITVPISLDENLYLFYSEERKMEPKKIREFIVFILSSALIYFASVNYYYNRNKN